MTGCSRFRQEADPAVEAEAFDCFTSKAMRADAVLAAWLALLATAACE